ncbi:unnamed protein product [Aphanomyces euteiches]
MLITLALLISLTAACSAKTTPGATGTKTPAEAATAAPDGTITDSPAAGSDANAAEFTISVGSWMLGTDANSSASAKEYKDTVEKLYKAIYPNASIKWNNFAGDKYFDVLKAKLASNSAEDVFWHQNAMVPFGNAGYLADLSDQPWVSDMNDPAKSASSYKGKIVAAAWDTQGWGMFYNKKVFADLGLSGTPKTFAEFVDIAQKAKDAGLIPITAGFKDGWPALGTVDAFMPSFLFGSNPNWGFDLYDGKTKINSPEMVAAFTSFEQLVQKGFYSKGALSTTYDQAQLELSSGKAAMMMIGTWLPSDFMSKFKTELGFFPIPDDKGHVIVDSSTVTFLSVNAAYKEKKRATDLISVMISKDAYTAFKQPFTPYKSLSMPNNLQGNIEYSKALETYTPAVQVDSVMPPSATSLLQQIITKIVSGKKLDTKDLDEADKAYQKDKNLVNIGR